MPIRAVVFDFDGVILESANIKTEAFVELFGHLPEHQRQAVLQHHLDHFGVSRFKKFEWIYANLLERELSDAESQRLGEEFSRIALDKVLAAPFVPGAEAALDALVADHPLFVASGTPEDELRHIVEARGLARYFKGVWGSPTEKPAIVRDVLTSQRLRHAEVLLVGDGTSDHRAAVAAGVQFLARDTPEHHDTWVKLGVRREPDLCRLPEVVRTWE